jgi:alpha-beta hydrolase superfamily lysophospholipase
MRKQKLLKGFGMAVVCLLLQACTEMLFVPTRQLVITPDKINLKYSDIELKSRNDVLLHGWYLPASVPVKGSILFLHGNGENISTHLATVYWLPAEGYDVYMFDYRGYGASQGEVGLDGSMADVAAMIDYVAVHKSTPRMIVFGHSMGASLGIYAVSQSPHKADMSAMISIGAFSDYRAVTRDVLSRSSLTWLFQWPMSLTIDNDFSPQKFVAQISPVPLVLMHSAADEIIEPYHLDVLYKAAVEPKTRVMLQGDHNHVFNYAENRKIFLEQLSRY